MDTCECKDDWSKSRWKEQFLIYVPFTFQKMYLELIIVSIALMCTSSIIYLLESLNFNYATDYSRKKRMSFGRIAFILYRASVGTSSPSLTILTSTRFMLGIWFLCSFILNSFYNTTLISFITRPGLEEQMTCLDDIVKNQLHIRFPPVYVFGID